MSSRTEKSLYRWEVDGLIFRTATAADSEAVVHLMATEFFPRSALCRCLEMKLPDDVDLTLRLIPSIIEEGVSLVVEDTDSNMLIGARLSSVETRKEAYHKHPPVIDAKFAKSATILRMFDHLSSPVDLFQRYGVSKVMAFKFLVVRESYGRRGIAKKLVELSLDVARDLKLELATTRTSSRYSERVFESHGFDRLNDLSIPDFVDPVTGGKPFAKLSPDAMKNAALFARRV